MKKAFSMIELIIVMVVLGILAINLLPRFQRNLRAEAIQHMLQVIRYTQNLALHDNKYEGNNSLWQKKFWRFEIRRCRDTGELYYNIGTDTNNNGSLSRNESAIDPSNGRFMFWPQDENCKNKDPQILQQVSPNIFIGKKFGISRVVFSSASIYGQNSIQTAQNNYYAFDYFGRVYKRYYRNSNSNANPNNYGIVVNDTTITFYFKDDSIRPFTIVIPNETGYAYLQENPKF